MTPACQGQKRSPQGPLRKELAGWRSGRSGEFQQEGRGASKRLKRREVGEPGKKPRRRGAAGGTRGLSQQEQMLEGRRRPSPWKEPLLLCSGSAHPLLPSGSAEGRKGEELTVQ